MLRLHDLRRALCVPRVRTVSLPLVRIKETDKRVEDRGIRSRTRTVEGGRRPHVSAPGVRGRSTRDLRRVPGQDHLALLRPRVSRPHERVCISWTLPELFRRQRRRGSRMTFLSRPTSQVARGAPLLRVGAAPPSRARVGHARYSPSVTREKLAGWPAGGASHVSEPPPASEESLVRIPSRPEMRLPRSMRSVRVSVFARSKDVLHQRYYAFGCLERVGRAGRCHTFDKRVFHRGTKDRLWMKKPT